MDENPQEEIKESIPSVDNEAEETAQDDPLKNELEKVQTKRSKREKLLYTKNRLEQQLRELDTEEGVKPQPDTTDEETPVTVGMLKKMQAETATKTALDLADDIPNETEKELVKFHINNSIKSTGNPNEDLSRARAIVNAAKNKQILEQIQNKPNAKRASSNGGGVPQKEEEPEFTEEELALMNHPLIKLSKEAVLKARKESEAQGK